MKRDTLIMLLLDLADLVDKPTGPGGGAIILEAVAEIEALQREVAAAKAVLHPSPYCGTYSVNAASDQDRV